MQIGIVGLPFAGKTTVFNAIAGNAAEQRQQTHGLEPTLASVDLHDVRLEALCTLFETEQCIPTEVQYLDFPGAGFGRQEKEAAWVATLRTVDALLIVLGAFSETQDPVEEIESIHLDLVLPDLQIVENRLQRLMPQLRTAPAAERQHLEREQILLERLRSALELGDAGASAGANCRRRAGNSRLSTSHYEAHPRGPQPLRGTVGARN